MWQRFAMGDSGIRTFTGRCDCGGVRYRIDGPVRNIIECHCEPCRRISGHHLAATAVANGHLHLESQETLAWYQRTPTVRYGFCSACSSTLFWRADDKADWTSVFAGTLDGPTGLVATEAICASEAGDYYHIDPDLDVQAGDRALELPY